jgi:para-nitrobenzyl esterase
VKKLLPILLFTFLGNHSSKAQNTRFLDPVFTAVTKTTVTYSDVFNDDYHKMDIYTPNNDNLSKRPLIVYVHGGAFYAGDKASQDCIDFCTAFAKKGYVAVSVNYRLANAFLFLSDKKIQLNAVLQSIADVKSSLRYFVKDASTTNQYKVDTTAFFLGGYSAGAVASLHTGWVTAESELDANLQDILKNGIKTLNGDAGNNGYSNPIKALYSMAGAVYQTSYISPNDLPVWMGHAKDDATVSYNCAPGLNNPLVVTLCGTGKMIPKLDSAGVKYDSMILETGGHSWPGLGNNGKDFKKAVTEIAEFFYPMIPQNTQSIKKPETYQAISIYPNPTQGFIQIIQYGTVKLGNYRIVNGMGQNVMSGFICDKQAILDLNHLPKGYYKLVWENSALEMQSIVVE